MLPENCDEENTPKSKLTNYENVVPVKSDSPPPVPPRNANKCPYYENHGFDTTQTVASKSSVPLPFTIDRQNSQKSLAPRDPVTCMENQSRFEYHFIAVASLSCTLSYNSLLVDVYI